MTCRNLVALALGTALAAGCGDQPDAVASETPRAKAPIARMTTGEYKAAKAKSADSLLAAAKPPGEVAKALGGNYFEASMPLRDSLYVLAERAGCFEAGQVSDPYLAGTADVYLYMSVVGSQIVRVEKSSWTSAAGNIVNACLNLAAKEWKFSPDYGSSGIHIAQLQFKQQ